MDNERPRIERDGEDLNLINNEDQKTEQDLRGTGLRIFYLLAMRDTEIGPRGIASSLDLSSPSLASYHLNKLVSEGFCDKTENGKYRVDQSKTRVSLLSHHMVILGQWIPRSVVIGIFSAILLILSIIFGLFNFPSIVWFLVFSPSLLILTMWLIYDGYQLTKEIDTIMNIK
jgi:hypothetical protein